MKSFHFETFVDMIKEIVFAQLESTFLVHV